MNATATYTKINNNEAVIEVSYPNGQFGLERVRAPARVSIYDAAYNAASIKAQIHGYRLNRFSEAP